MNSGISAIDIFQPRDNGLPDFTKITPAQIFNGSSAAAANAMKELDPTGVMSYEDPPWMRREGRRYTRIPGTGQIMEVRRARVVPEYINGKAARDRGHYPINDGSPNYTGTPAPELPAENTTPFDLPGGAGNLDNIDTPITDVPAEVPAVPVVPGARQSGRMAVPVPGQNWRPPWEQSYVPTDPMSSLTPPPAAEIRSTGHIPRGGYAPPDYSQPGAMYSQPAAEDDNLLNDPQDPVSPLLPRPDAIKMKQGAMNRLPTMLLDELKQLRFA